MDEDYNMDFEQDQDQVQPIYILGEQEDLEMDYEYCDFHDHNDEYYEDLTCETLV